MTNQRDLTSCICIFKSSSSGSIFWSTTDREKGSSSWVSSTFRALYVSFIYWVLSRMDATHIDYSLTYLACESQQSALELNRLCQTSSGWFIFCNWSFAHRVPCFTVLQHMVPSFAKQPHPPINECKLDGVDALVDVLRPPTRRSRPASQTTKSLTNNKRSRKSTDHREVTVFDTIWSSSETANNDVCSNNKGWTASFYSFISTHAFCDTAERRREGWLCFEPLSLHAMHETADCTASQRDCILNHGGSQQTGRAIKRCFDVIVTLLFRGFGMVRKCHLQSIARLLLWWFHFVLLQTRTRRNADSDFLQRFLVTLEVVLSLAVRYILKELAR